MSLLEGSGGSGTESLLLVELGEAFGLYLAQTYLVGGLNDDES